MDGVSGVSYDVVRADYCGVVPSHSNTHIPPTAAYDETGLEVAETDPLGPVLERSATFDFRREHVVPDEEFYLARIEAPVSVRHKDLAAAERSFVDEVPWWNPADRQGVQVERFLEAPPDLIARLLDGRLALQPYAPDDDAGRPGR